MDYQKHYNVLISRARKRNLQGYSEKHHIIPKCLGGSNKKNNIVTLTAKEHFLAHLLLVEIYPEEWKLKIALFYMSHPNTSSGKGLKIGARTYERLKKENCKALKNRDYSERNHWGKDNHNHERFWIKNVLTRHEMMISESQKIPKGYEKGRFDIFREKRFTSKGRSWYNNGVVEALFIINQQDEGFTKGRLPLQRRRSNKKV